MHLLGHVGIWKKMLLIDAKWDIENPKRGGLERFDPQDLQPYHVSLTIKPFDQN